jgi:hypothetical protein
LLLVATSFFLALILTLEVLPELWATTQNILGVVYRIRIAGDRAQYLEQAIVCYQNALQVLTQKAFPELHHKSKISGLNYSVISKLLLM